ncbi:stage II sporulation protein D [Ruminiclostridium sufflavum DSM 19573]|uniref:Stage II sporulation protein D n=1 Tax=Ruminiclostridium sufflavum DSM 19573 TaxID=1121337 RepID=A0A318XM39_9FIRM|nr:SpoIID/LytB domain-containing protein [Ruminiclostridium sufflavum]PYG87012.1 stage II sporulation protein D [Ruminiclostridium sufflavum DSM 19573]
MKKICLLLSAILILMMLPGANFWDTDAASDSNIKIGLYFKTTAQSQIDISSNKGVSFFAFDSINNKEYPVYSSAEGEAITIRKDGYFTNSGLKYTAIVDGANTEGATSGPFHIKIGNSSSTYKDALSIAQGYTKKGTASYPVYTDSGWNVWTGFYISRADAEKAIAAVKAKLGDSSYAVIEKADTRIYGVSGTGEVRFMYASEKNLLRGKSLSSETPNPINIGSDKLNSYRGQVEFYRKTDSDMTIINVLPFEEYLYGVVPNEMQASSNPEALKAQAIAARTYSYKMINKHAAYGFNLCTTTDCHVYKGYASESTATNKAVDDTKNMVVTYNGSLAETLYFSSSGGRTEAAVNVWGTDFPYLQSVEDKYESGQSYKYNWSVTYTVDEISKKLESYGVGRVTSIEITKCSEAGRPVELVIKGTSKPEGVVITKDRCRTFLGLYSQWYTINNNGDGTADVNVYIKNQNMTKQINQLKVITASGETKGLSSGKVTIVGANGIKTSSSESPTTASTGFTFVGKGWGHAVGMSQEGAKGYADAGRTYDWILQHYYSGTKIELKK